MFPETKNIPLTEIHSLLLNEKQIRFFVLRLDTIHPFISGNKWFKLKYNLQAAREQNKNTLLTFGGAYSNHIAATAAAGKEFGFETVGIIRGEELAFEKQRKKNPVLKFASDCGMKLKFISRENYRQKNIPGEFVERNNSYFLPEGGTNELAVKGCSEILSLIDIPFDYVCCATGTGGTLAGIISSLKKNQTAIGFPVLKGGKFLKNDITKLLLRFQVASLTNWEINTGYHFGGYAKKNPELLHFISGFQSTHNIPLDFVYTGKLFYGIFDLLKKNYFRKGATIMAIHTGGVSFSS